MKRREEGQILVMFAAVVIVLIGISALVVDIGMKYSFERRYQSIADSASLAGAQELQPTTRTSPVTPQMKKDARTEALGIVLTELIGTTTDPHVIRRRWIWILIVR
jgi:Flp pilus assembly protein TadG